MDKKDSTINVKKLVLKVVKPEKLIENEFFPGRLIGEHIVSEDSKAITFNQKRGIGEFKRGKVMFSLIESLFLVDRNKLIIHKNKKQIGFETLFNMAKKKDKNIYPKFVVFKDLMNRGYIVKTALKFGADFRVYNKGIKPGQDHAKWLLFPVFETDNLTWYDFSAKNRVAHSTRKNLLIAIVDQEGDVVYYEIKWIRP